MKRKTTYLTGTLLGLSLCVGANATESVVYVDDDPANTDSTVVYTPNAAAWTESTFFPQTYGQGYHFSRTTGATLTMRASLDIDETGGGPDNLSGTQFQAFFRWSAGNNRCNAVRVEVRNATGNFTVTSEIVNQTTQGHQFNWVPVGSRFTATPNQLYEIRVTSPGVCVTTADGGMFVQQTYDGSDVSNLTAFDTIDEAGLDFDQTPASISISSVDTCATREILKQVSVFVPDSTSTSYVVCRASGFNIHSQVNKWLFMSIDETTGTAWDVYRYTSASSAIGVNDYQNWDMQKVYTVGSEGGNQTYYLKACRQDTATTGTAYHDDFVCEMFPTRY